MAEVCHDSSRKRNISRIETTLTESTPVGPGARILSFTISAFDQPPLPGQFFMVKILDAGFPLFGRPFRVFDYRCEGRNAHLDFLVQAVGPGTEILNAAAPGSPALLVGPAGCGFPALREETDYVFVGGGTGIAPLHHLMHELSRHPEKEISLRLVYGARDKASLFAGDRFGSLPYPVDLCTEDGSQGEAGMVDTPLCRILDKGEGPANRVIYACGPDPMMRAVARLGVERGLPTYLSLETRMACGTGICNGCAISVEPRPGDGSSLKYLRVCHEGPVFEAANLPDFRPSP